MSSATLTSISALSKEYVKVEIEATVDGVAKDPTADVVQLAFVAVASDPAGGDWKTGSWETASGKYYARLLVGPGGTIELAEGRYSVWVKVTDNPEAPVLRAGEIEVF